MIDSSYASAENIAAYLRRIKKRAGIFRPEMIRAQRRIGSDHFSPT